MHLYEVWVCSRSFRGHNRLTYSSDEKLALGTIVEVPLRNQSCLAIVAGTSKESIPNIKQISTNHGIIIPKKHLELLNWLQVYYPGPSGITTGLFLPTKIVQKEPKIGGTKHEPSLLPALTEGQAKVLGAMQKVDGNQTILLHGDTGSGKTRIYLELARKVVASGQSVVILTPEIGLVPQTAAVFEDQFPQQVITYHSDMTPSRRSNLWHQARNTQEPLIVVGPRSALFLPLSNIGLIVVDEAHEKTYKQDQSPHYQTTRVAAKLATLHNSPLLLGTATPLVADYYALEQKGNSILRLSQLAHKDVQSAKITAVDLTDKSIRKTGVISSVLLDAIKKRLDCGEQSLLFLNRRGSARMVLCQNCGWSARCPRCDISLVYHSDSHNLRCHTCGYAQPPITSCPECHSADIIYQSPGVKALEDQLKQYFPDAVIRRFDSDNSVSEKLERHYQDIIDSKVDIIIGTQMVTKGLDIPNLSLVGILSAESSLQIPDFSASEQMYQMIRQAMGRVGRTSKKTEVIVQTYHPDSHVLKSALENDWATFYKQELAERKKYAFPPFCYLLQLTTTMHTLTKAQEAANKLARQLQTNKNIAVRGVGPAFHEKVAGKYCWQVVISSKNRSDLLDVIGTLPPDWRYDIDPNNLL